MQEAVSEDLHEVSISHASRDQLSVQTESAQRRRVRDLRSSKMHMQIAA